MLAPKLIENNSVVDYRAITRFSTYTFYLVCFGYQTTEVSLSISLHSYIIHDPILYRFYDIL